MSTIKDVMKEFTLVESGLHGSEIINRLQRGHVVRRAAWIDGLYSRITNERGFDENGLAIFKKCDSIYTIGTNGLFTHIGFSDQKLRNPSVYLTSYGFYEESVRCAEGMNGLFQNDWEDYGFMTREHFQEVKDRFKDIVWKNWRDAVQREVDKANAKLAADIEAAEIAAEAEMEMKMHEVDHGWEDNFIGS